MLLAQSESVTLQLTFSQSVSQSVRPSWLRNPSGKRSQILVVVKTVTDFMFNFHNHSKDFDEMWYQVGGGAYAKRC
jgi:hypothetical protein